MAMMGVGGKKLAWGTDSAAPPLRHVLYYAYHKGFWSLIRGCHFVPGCDPAREILSGTAGKGALSQLSSVGHNVAIGDYVS